MNIDDRPQHPRSGGADLAQSLQRRRRPSEILIVGALLLCSVVSVATTVGILYELGKESLLFFRDPLVSVVEFVTTTVWQPQAGSFGIWPLILGTLSVALIAILVAIPMGLASAIYLSEYASTRFRAVVKPIVEILVGVPTVVYGFFALTFMTPLLRSLLGSNVVQFFNVASAGIVVGILITPLISSLSEDALRAVPDSLRQASYALGASKMEVSLKVVLPAALSGVGASVVVAMSRAVGETMVVALAAGAAPRNFLFGEDPLFGFILNPFIPGEAMTGHIARVSSGDLSYNSIDYNSIFAIGLTLFFMTLGLNILSRALVRRFRQDYG